MKIFNVYQQRWISLMIIVLCNDSRGEISSNKEDVLSLNNEVVSFKRISFDLNTIRSFIEEGDYQFSNKRRKK